MNFSLIHPLVSPFVGLFLCKALAWYWAHGESSIDGPCGQGPKDVKQPGNRAEALKSHMIQFQVPDPHLNSAVACPW